MDAQSIMINNGNMQFLSSAILKPYQKAIMAHIRNSLKNLNAKKPKVSLEKALEELASSLGRPAEDAIQMKVDEHLAQMVLGSQTLKRSCS